MSFTILVSALIWIVYLLIEKIRVVVARKKIPHVIHVNGTRGKSSVCRLIEAGLRNGGMRVFCKTTGINPTTIDVDGEERIIPRKGCANIKEQVEILCKASKQNVQILVVECMAVRPELQHVTQHSILRADICAITNVRRDHTDVMGESLQEIADALSNTIPRNGILFTTEEAQTPILKNVADRLCCRFVPVQPDDDEQTFDFSENIALALAVCEYLGVEREKALAGMKRYKRDPFALSLYRWGKALFINALSVNDIQSTHIVWETLSNEYNLNDKRLVILMNNRSDRGSRTRDMTAVCEALQPNEIWLMGASRIYVRRKLNNKLPNTVVKMWSSAEAIPSKEIEQDKVIFAIGNIANDGLAIMRRVREEGIEFVR